MPEHQDDSEEENLEGTVMIEQSMGKEKCKLCPKFVDPDNHLACNEWGQVFCTKCIMKKVDSGKPCPECNTKLDKKKLKPSKLYQKMAKNTNTKLKTLKEKSVMKEVKKVAKEGVFICGEHETESDMYCRNCQKTICSICITETASHSGHEFKNFNKYYDDVRQRLGKKLYYLINIK